MSFPTDFETNFQMLLRWIHFLAGITWIGLLYFFNLVNVNFMKSIDAPTKGKVIPQLMPRALWWFRWGAVITVLVGLEYYRRIITSEPAPGRVFFTWLIIVLVTYAILYALLQPVSGALNNGWLLAILTAVIIAIMAYVIVSFNGHPTPTTEASNRALSIGIGGGIGIIMLLNVWGIIWPHQKRIIAWTAENAAKGTAIPPEAAKLGRRAFLASRMNFYLSMPMLFFMGAASHYPFLGVKPPM